MSVSKQAIALAGWTNPEERAHKIDEALRETRAETTRVLASALQKFAPDLTAELIERYQQANSAFDDLLELLREDSSVERDK